MELMFPKRFVKTYTVAAALAAGAVADIGISEADGIEYGSFNTVIINNTSTQLISFLPNNDLNKKIPISSSFALDDTNFKTASIKNEDAAAVTDGAVYITVMNTVNFRTMLIAMRQIMEDVVKAVRKC